ncbi:MAG: serine/threonine-protein kinase [Bryobacteraceae bacterium]|nr:serine/threonine-protein kinase [Bryobacteraceae bacterium]
MKTCQSCGTVLTAGADTCGRCGIRPGQQVSDETIRMETVAMAVPAPPSATPAFSRSPTSSSVLRFHTSATEDEGRFVPGTLIAGRYRMIELLGRGGMGEVYRATDLTLAQSVALKFLPNAADNTRLIERFHNEVRIARQVSHPNVCRVYDIGEAEGMPFLSMEYVDGEDLSSLLQRIGRLPNDKALDITRRICAGVAAAHERGIIHRDLKPQNIMLNRRGEVVIMDFGLAAIADELRGAEARNGTPAYMSPEQLRGDNVTPKSDIYALGLIIYEVFTGRRAFEATTLADLIQQQEARSPVSLTTLVSDADPAVEKIVLRCLDPDPARRPASALQVAAALPGGDPLAAALAAGEMPSPQLVAASGKAEGIQVKYAVACLIVVLAGLLAQPFLALSNAMPSIAPPPLSVPVLQQKASELIAALGHKPAVRDRDSGFYTDSGFLNYLRDRDQGKPRDWHKLLTAETPYRLDYRQSPNSLLAPPDGEVRMDRPSLSLPGMVSLTLDGSGHLRMLEAVVGGTESASPPVEPSAVFQAAGFDIAKFTPVDPVSAPPLAFDQRLAWKGKHPALPDIDITVELATWKGLPVSFQIYWPWSPKPDTEKPEQDIRSRIFSMVSVVLLAVGLFCAIYFARYNLRRGRGDKQGAFALAGTLGLLIVARFFLRVHYVPDFAMIDYIFTNIGWALLSATLMWLGYIALEPMVRATWPRSLITWNRVLVGHLGDPQVGSQILIGATVGMLMHFVFLWRQQWTLMHGALPGGMEEALFRGPAYFIALYVNTFHNAIWTSLIIFFVLCGVKALLRLDWLAALAAALLMTTQEGTVRNSSNLAMDLGIYILIFGVFAFMLLRMGIVPSIAAILFINSTARIYTAPDFLHWINSVAVVQILMLASVALFAFWRSQSCPDLRTS